MNGLIVQALRALRIRPLKTTASGLFYHPQQSVLNPHLLHLQTACIRYISLEQRSQSTLLVFSVQLEFEDSLVDEISVREFGRSGIFSIVRCLALFGIALENQVIEDE